MANSSAVTILDGNSSAKTVSTIDALITAAGTPGANVLTVQPSTGAFSIAVSSITGGTITSLTSGTVTVTSISSGTIASLSSGSVTLLAGSQSIGTVSISSIQLQPLSTQALAMSAGYQLVALPTDQAAVAIKSGAIASAVPSSAVYVAGNAITSLPTAASAGNLTGVSFDKFGRQVVLPNTIRDLVGTQVTTVSSTTETTIITAGSAGVFNDLLCLILSNTSSATSTRVDIRDATGGTVIASLESVGGAPPVGIPYMGTPIPQTTSSNNWTAQAVAAVTDIRIFAVYAKNK